MLLFSSDDLVERLLEVAPHTLAIQADVRASGDRLFDQDQQQKRLDLIRNGVDSILQSPNEDVLTKDPPTTTTSHLSPPYSFLRTHKQPINQPKKQPPNSVAILAQVASHSAAWVSCAGLV